MPKFGISYIRFSSKTQASGDSLRRQYDATEKYCAEHGITLIENYQDLGVPAKDGINSLEGELSLLVEHVKAGSIEKGTFLIVESLDRLSRDKIRAQVRLFLGLLEAGLNIVTLADNERVYYHDDHEKAEDGEAIMLEMMVSLIVMSRAYNESKMKSERIKAAISNRYNNAKNKPISRVIPSWCKIKDNKIEEITERANVVRDIYKWALEENMGINAITTRLNKRGVPTWGSVTHKTPQPRWTKKKVSSWLSSPSVMGHYVPHIRRRDRRIVDETKEPILDYYPPVIDEKTFNAVQAKRRTRKKVGSGGRSAHHYNNLLQKLAYCECGFPLHYHNKNDYIYLKCREKDGKNCNAPSLGYALLRDLVLTNLNTFDWATALNGGSSDDEQIRQKNEILELKIAVLEKKCDVLEKDYDDADDEETFTRLSKMITKNTAKISELRSQIQEVVEHTSGDRINLINQLAEGGTTTFDYSKVETRRNLHLALKNVVEKVTVKPSSRLAVTLKIHTKSDVFTYVHASKERVKTRKWKVIRESSPTDVDINDWLAEYESGDLANGEGELREIYEYTMQSEQ